jgi:hypothetical protein
MLPHTMTLVLEIAGIVAAPRKAELEFRTSFGPSTVALALRGSVRASVGADTLTSSPRLASNSDPFASRHDSTCSAL